MLVQYIHLHFGSICQNQVHTIQSIYLHIDSISLLKKFKVVNILPPNLPHVYLLMLGVYSFVLMKMNLPECP